MWDKSGFGAMDRFPPQHLLKIFLKSTKMEFYDKIQEFSPPEGQGVHNSRLAQPVPGFLNNSWPFVECFGWEWQHFVFTDGPAVGGCATAEATQWKWRLPALALDLTRQAVALSSTNPSTCPEVIYSWLPIRGDMRENCLLGSAAVLFSEVKNSGLCKNVVFPPDSFQRVNSCKSHREAASFAESSRVAFHISVFLWWEFVQVFVQIKHLRKFITGRCVRNVFWDLDCVYIPDLSISCRCVDLKGESLIFRVVTCDHECCTCFFLTLFQCQGAENANLTLNTVCSLLYCLLQ